MLQSGSNVGVYEVIALLGEGGMGEVYRARDTRLDRVVAIKLLPSQHAATVELRDRFEREARVIAALNHPHICTLYDVGRDGDRDFLIMECLEGETLEQRLHRGALPFNEALRVALDIGKALDHAHRAGIVHRDIKPGNIFLTKAGAKLLDFGLARATQPAGATPALSMVPTTPPSMTAVGTILGTFQYMAPEQLEGEFADARTDIFALGAVVHETLTGRKAFQGNSQASLISSILSSVPPPISGVQPASSPQLDHVIDRCLAKAPDDRWQTAADFVRELEWTQTATPPSSFTSSTAVARNRWWAPLATVGALAFVAGVSVYVASRDTTHSASPAARFEVAPPDGTTFATGDRPASLAVISPDGRRLAFTARDATGRVALWVRPLDSVTAVPFPNTEDAQFPFWSPDSGFIGFFAAGKLLKVSADGGPPQTLSDAAGRRGGSWGDNGTIVFGGSSRSLQRVSATGGLPEDLVPPEFGDDRFPSFLPGGKHVLVYNNRQGSAESGVYLTEVNSGRTRHLLSADSSAVYADGYLLFVRESMLLAQAFDLSRLTLVADPVPIAEHVETFAYAGVTSFSVSVNGVLAYGTGTDRAAALQLAWFDRTGRALGKVGAPANYAGIALSPDGSRLAAHHHEGSGGDIWLVDLATHMSSRFTFNAANDNSSPIWSPDGKQIAFGSRQNGKWGVYTKATNGAVVEQLQAETGHDETAPKTWAPDGQSIVYATTSNTGNTDLWRLTLADRKVVPFQKTEFSESQAQISPNGRWISYGSNESGQNNHVYIRPYPHGDGKWQVAGGAGMSNRWRRDGKELFYTNRPVDPQLTAVAIDTSMSAVATVTSRVLFQTSLRSLQSFSRAGHSSVFNCDVSHDGERFIMAGAIASDSRAPGSFPIVVVQNWLQGVGLAGKGRR